MTTSKTPNKYYQTDHGPEIFPHRYTLTSEEKRWRKAAAAFLEKWTQSAPVIPLAANVLREHRATYQVQPSPKDSEASPQIRSKLWKQLTEILLTLRVIDGILKGSYGSQISNADPLPMVL